MEKNQDLDLLWEKNFGGSIGIYKPAKKFIFSPGLMKNLALSKMKDITLISADFNDNLIFFYPFIWLLLDSGYSIKFFGLYATEPSDNRNDNLNELEDVPSFCIKKAFWNQSEDIANFQHAKDKRMYIVSENQVRSNISFINSTHSLEITQLISEAIEMTKYGLKLNEERNISAYDEININVSDDGFRFNFSYYPRLVKNEILDKWVIEWCNCFERLPLDLGYTPDEKIRISYELSLFDKISMFDAIQR